MKLIVHFVALIIYTSTVNPSQNNDLEDKLMSVIGEVDEANNENFDEVHVKDLNNDDYNRRAIKNRVKKPIPHMEDESDEDTDNLLMSRWKPTGTKGNRGKKTSHKKQADNREPLQNFMQNTYNQKSDKAVTSNNAWAQERRIQPGKLFKKPSKQFLLAKPNDVASDLEPRPLREKAFIDKRERYRRDIISARDKAKIVMSAKKYEAELNDLKLPNRMGDGDTEKSRFKIDNVLNVRRRARSDSGSTSQSDSSSREMMKWKDEFKKEYMKKKQEALMNPPPAGDVVNMVAANPWGVQCGDPNQHDMPWGSCTLAFECESEYRIYRGDSFCGRTEYVCCAIQMHTYDMYQALDVSLNTDSMATDSNEKKDMGKKKKKKKNDSKSRLRRRKRREKRKKKIKRKIKDIVIEMQKILNKQFKNGTKLKKKRTNKLKKFVKKLKKQYKKDRETLMDIHEEDMIKIDSRLWERLRQIKEMNVNFINNGTFRDIVVNGTINKIGARMLVEAYPDLQPFVLRMLRRAGGADDFGDYLEYDLEYGYLYY